MILEGSHYVVKRKAILKCYVNNIAKRKDKKIIINMV